MIEIIISGRGGQGIVTAKEILCDSLLDQDIEPQGIPQFGAERAGAPVIAFVRIKNIENEILPICKIKEPDCLVVFDYSLTEQGKNLLGLKENGILLINSGKEPLYFENLGPFRIATIDATNTARELKIGDEISPKINTVMLGALTKIFGFNEASLEFLCQRIKKKFGEHADKNIEAAERGYEEVKQ